MTKIIFIVFSRKEIRGVKFNILVRDKIALWFENLEIYFLQISSADELQITASLVIIKFSSLIGNLR